MIGETNEVIRIICGKLMRTAMQSNDVTLKSFWHVHCNKGCYEGFPIGPQVDEEWSQLFSGYIDNLFNDGWLAES